MLKLLSYPRALFVAPFTVLWTVLCSSLVVLLISFANQKNIAVFIISKIWARFLLFVSGVEVQLLGAEKLPKDKGCLYLFNHTSHYDIVVMFGYSPRFCHFGAKSELLSIPFFGHAGRKTGMLPIERKNREKVMQIYKEAEKRVAAGDVFALAPEGTRREGHGTLGEFKAGPFFFAVNSQMPLVPVVLVGCEKIMPKYQLLANWGRWKQKVIFEILDPIYPQGTSEEQIPRLKQASRQVMLERLQYYWAREQDFGI